MLRPNDNGLFDMHGNAWEWTQGVYSQLMKTDDNQEEAASEGVKDKDRRVLRGSSFGIPAVNVGSAIRYWIEATYRYNWAGVRPARTVTP
jgi:formylglycine-generating enzyme required for sulfatase activity